MSSDATPVPATPPPPQPSGPRLEHKSRPRDDELLTRKPMALWDRVKFLLLLSGVWGVLLWARLVDNPILPFGEAVDDAVRTRWWLLALIGVEALRQFHYMISETSPRYHHLWSDRIFGGFETKSSRLNDWNRYRMSRVLKIIIFVLLLALILGAVTNNPPITALFELPSTLVDAMPLILQVVFFMFLAVIQFVAIFWFLSRGGVDVYFPDDIKTRFSDVWGQDGVVERVKENILFLEDPESIEAKGGHVPTGILLWGPPGTGKTLMAEAVAGETGKPYVFVDPGAFNAMFMGVGIMKVKALFRKLRKLAVRYGGVIVFFDEADSLGSRGQLTQGGVFGRAEAPDHLAPSCNGASYLSPTTTSLLSSALGTTVDATLTARPGLVNRFVMGAGMGGGGGMGTLQALLTELSGLKKPRGFMNRVVRKALGMRPKPPPKYRILVMMATNMPEALDEALLRPGRIDRIYKVGYPAKPGRVRTYEGYFAKVRHRLTAEEIDKLAIMTPYATGATIKDLVNEALIVAIRDGRDEITWTDVVKAKQLKALGPSEDSEYIERERHAVAVHEACHAVAAYKVRHHYVIDMATIERRGQVGGFVSSIPPEDRFVHWRSEYEADIMVALASLAGERLFFEGDNSAGVSGDLVAATEVATIMEGYLGMGSTVSVHGVIHKVGIGGGGRAEKEGEAAERINAGLGDRIEKNLEDLLRRTEDLLRENRTSVLAVAHALETHKTMDGDDVAAVMENRQGPLVDGRVYVGEEFARAIEDYHSRALVAHKSHTAVDVALPGLNGHLPTEASVVIGSEGEITI